MPAPRVYRTEAVVLKAFDYGEADRILTLFSPNHGKLRAIAKGVRKTKSRMSGHVDLFTRSTLLVATGRQLDIVTQAETLESFRPVRENLERLSRAHYIAELVDGFAAERQANYPLYALTVATLRRLGEELDRDLVVRSFELQLLGFTGYRPQLHRCLSCDEAIQPRPNYFSAEMGGALCPSCAVSVTSASPISVPALKVLRNLQTQEEQMLRLPALAADVRREVEKHLQEYVVYRLESRPKSLSFIERLRSEAAPV